MIRTSFFRNKIKNTMNWFIHISLRLLLAFYLLMLSLAKALKRRCRPVDGDGYEILLTGTFYSDNWILSHLCPLAHSQACKVVYMVAQNPVPEISKVVPVYPPKWLNNIVGTDISRLLIFFWTGFSLRPHMVGGFHLLLNGLSSLLLSKIVGARSLYICGGGPREILGGGYSTENRIFSKLNNPDTVIEKMLIRAISDFDLVIVRGKRAVRFFKNRNATSNFYIVPGGIDGRRFRQGSVAPTFDLIFVGRLSSVKRVNLFLNAVKIIKESIPAVRVVVVGDGPLLESLKKLSQDLDIGNNVQFVGQQANVEDWLKQSKVFVLTSKSEGRSLAMMEAMLTGLPVVVPRVGDLDEMVDDNINGYLVSKAIPANFAEKIRALLLNPERLETFGKAAIRKAQECEMGAVSRLWDSILDDHRFSVRRHKPAGGSG